MFISKKTIGNFFSLSIIQFFNYLFPLITLPYVVRIVEVDYYGKIVFAQTIVSYFAIIIDYGFRLTGTKAISLNINNKDNRSEIYVGIISIRLILLLTSLVFLSLLPHVFAKLNSYQTLLLFTTIPILGDILLPTFFFQGIERMRILTKAHFFARMISLIGLFLFVRERSDYLIYPLINGIGKVIVGVVLIVWMVKSDLITIRLPKINDLKILIKDATPIFSSNFFVRIYSASFVFILGLQAGDVAVGIFGAAKRIIDLIIQALQPAFDAIFPNLARSPIGSIKKIKKIYQGTILFCLIITTTYFLTAKFSITLIFGNAFLNATPTSRLLSLLILVIPLSKISYQLVLVPFGKTKKFFSIFLSANIIALASLFIMYQLPISKVTSTAISTIATELFILSIGLLLSVRVLREQNLAKK